MSEKVNVLLMGGGGREHALAMKIAESPRLGEFYTTHGENPGIAALAMPVDVPVSIREAYRLQQFIEKRRIGLVVIGPEDPLAEGFADKLRSPACRVFGPTRAGAQLEADKAWSKQLMRGALIPTGDARVFGDAESARAYVESRASDDLVLREVIEKASLLRDPADRRASIDAQRRERKDVRASYDAHREDLPVIKAAGLAKGKGVFLPSSLREAIDVIDRIMVRREFGDAGQRVVIEERLTGREVSVLAITDGSSLLVLPPTQDHKRLGDGDTGPNTGGMGAFCPAGTVSDDVMARTERDVLVPVLDALRREGIDYRGVLYAGLMLTHAGPRVLEFNCRFGDPECQAILPRLKSDLLELLIAACDGRLAEAPVEWDDRSACCVVLAAEGYPENPKKGVPITGVETASAMPDVLVFHAGTRRTPEGTLVTNGGRVLNVVALGETLETARAKAYEAASAIGFAGKVMRSDIGATTEPVNPRGAARR